MQNVVFHALSKSGIFFFSFVLAIGGTLCFSTLYFFIIKSTMCFLQSWPKQNVKPRFLGRTGMKIGVYGVVFHGADARDVQKCAALQNNAKNV